MCSVIELGNAEELVDYHLEETAFIHFVKVRGYNETALESRRN